VSENSAVRVGDDGNGSMSSLSRGWVAIKPPMNRGHVNGDPLESSTPIAKGWTSSNMPEQTASIILQMMDELPQPERADVLRRCQHLSADAAPHNRDTENARRWIARFLALCCLVLIPWTIGLALTLPRNYLVGNWPLAWTGFDIVLLGCLSTTAWALWRQRQVAVPAAMITSALLLCDAWFDILTAHTGRCLIVSIATAVFAELPIAALLGLTSIRLLRINTGVARRAEPTAMLQPLWRTPLVFPQLYWLLKVARRAVLAARLYFEERDQGASRLWPRRTAPLETNGVSRNGGRSLGPKRKQKQRTESARCR
jgi:hypothetical protein